jgi:hypothetical protein
MCLFDASEFAPPLLVYTALLPSDAGDGVPRCNRLVERLR